jgi:integrase
VTDDEADRLLLACGWGDAQMAELATQRVGVAILWALETAMRAGEIVGLRWRDIDADGRVARLPQTKNGTARAVPLSKAAIALLPCLPAGEPDAQAFGLSSETLDTLFRRARIKAGIADLHFHDSRHEAITRLARKLDVLDLARMIGHRDIKQLMTYYNATPAEIAARLD